jgi:hypothetical protein
MKGWMLLVLLLSTSAWAEPAAVHGMLLVGQEKIFLSHLPMFHSPHDQQALIEVELDDKAMAILAESRKSSDETVYTIVPEPFVLTEFLARPHSFRAELYRGHFERGGELLDEFVNVKVKSILFQKKLSRSGSQPMVPTYLLFGSAKEQFLAHEIHGAPDFDAVYPVVAPGLEGLQRLEIADSLQPGKVRAREAAGKIVELEVSRDIYFETGDLAH